MLLSCLGLDSISLKFLQWENLPFLSSLDYFNCFDYSYLFPTIFNLDTKLATLGWCRLFYLWRFCHCSDYSLSCTPRKRSRCSYICYLFFLQCLGSSYLPNPRTLAPSSNEGFALFAGTAVNDTSSVTATASAWDSLYQSNTLEAATIVKLTRTLAILPITLFLSYWQSRPTRQQPRGKA